MKFRSLTALIRDFERDGFSIRYEDLAFVGGKHLVITIPKDSAVYKVHMQDFMRLGKFKDYHFTNLGCKSEIWLNK